ncbi:hypothetical protein HBI81_122810 [Parastagonospora nodorum]|nr:hypothetical protein HBH92_232000 [Parastagonospora nodorum]KAH4524834.1 hypothetical protein HBH86_235550 [Parastagonospora nodorum]KAH4839198.1 hypothetical protein HBH59_239730 [Parastagonospora nodorum]KAH5028550.1 hypothetical protein HBI75_132580 [Parastagonospora nodorum]KAH5165729.1 hypothetical protein HBI73_027450 [Parastagonospora nodorum]
MSSDNGSTPRMPPPEEEMSESSPNKLPHSDVTFVSGPQNRYRLRCRTRWRSVRSSASDWDTFGIYTPYWSAFKHDTGIFMGGVNDDGDVQITKTWNEAYMIKAKDTWRIGGLYQAAELDLRTCQRGSRKVKRVSISIGPEGAYFARSRTLHIAHALPNKFQRAIAESESPPIEVALGMKEAWIVLFEDGSRSWDLRSAYPSLAGNGKLDNEEDKVVFAALSPYRKDDFSLTLKNECEHRELRLIRSTYI